MKTKALDRPEIKSFVEFYLDKGAALVREVGYVALSSKEQELMQIDSPPARPARCLQRPTITIRSRSNSG